MKIRWKLLILLLIMAMVPLIAAAVLHHVSVHRLGGHLASGRREILTQAARHHLHRMVDDYGRIVRRDRKMLELALIFQAREVERRLASVPPASPRMFLAEDYDGQVNLPEGMVLSDKHFRTGPDGKLLPIPVTYQQQVYFLVSGVSRQAVADDTARLSTMPEVYRLLYRCRPDLMYWQYTSLESGIHSCYPGHGGYPTDYDPRRRRWYLAAKQADDLIWLIMPEVSTRTVAPTLAMPVHRADGSFAGVTAIDMPLAAILGKLKLPADWASEAKTMLVVPEEQKQPVELHSSGPGEHVGNSEQDRKLVIIAQRSYEGRRQNWREVVELQFLESDDRHELAALTADALSGVSGVRKMRFRGRDALWAYGAGGKSRPFPVVVVPYDLIIAQTVEAEQYVLTKIKRSVKAAGGFLLVAFAVIVIVAFVSSRSVTRPVTQLAKVAQKLAVGNYDTRIDIRTGDELQALGEIVNDVGPKLRERQRMQHSLMLAMEVQQNLLPQEFPHLAGFDIAGAADYCDETGGDYYDFIELLDAPSSRLGIAIGDITSHGIGAALLMASARAILRSHAVAQTTELDKLFADINVHLVRDTGESWFLTLFYCVIDAESRTLSYASAGHDPVLWLHAATGQIDELTNTGIPLGILLDAPYRQGGPLRIERGDVLVLSTDGVREGKNPAGQMFGTERLKQVVRSCLAESAETICKTVMQAAEKFRDGHVQEDDITLVVVKGL
ncbi:MAG: SpoIIE family protein phosphatase [Planctomycetota bacterium]|nr:SpoIIE family protein phosphatase [Planctomycetota bacterium]